MFAISCQLFQYCPVVSFLFVCIAAARWFLTHGTSICKYSTWEWLGFDTNDWLRLLSEDFFLVYDCAFRLSFFTDLIFCAFIISTYCSWFPYYCIDDARLSPSPPDLDQAILSDIWTTICQNTSRQRQEARCTMFWFSTYFIWCL